ncbi:MAG: transglutaminase domain-containing protein, partial [Candidatus Competibacteraceae bacterium]|nr:transglutaminase domain-containing protein [Candidatus Competibacteraceae bacterium]
GDSRRFATAFCVLCRQQGLPSRVVAGFQPGTFNKLNGTYEVHGSDTFTWTEVLFLNTVGWPLTLRLMESFPIKSVTKAITLPLSSRLWRSNLVSTKAKDLLPRRSLPFSPWLCLVSSSLSVSFTVSFFCAAS